MIDWVGRSVRGLWFQLTSQFAKSSVSTWMQQTAGTCRICALQICLTEDGVETKLMVREVGAWPFVYNER